jgi:hypothetical protein
MRKPIHVLLLAGVMAGCLPALIAPARAADAAAAPAPRYTVDTTLVGTLLDDPAVNALLKKMIPSVYGNEMFHSMGRDQTLKAIQQYEPEALSDENLAKIQAELDKIPAKK